MKNKAAIVSQPFDAGWTRATAQRYFEIEIAGNHQSDEADQADALLTNALAGHLMFLSASGSLTHPANTEVFKVDWLYHWGKLIEAPENQEAARYVAKSMGSALSSQMSLSAMGSPQAQDNLYAKIVSHIKTGSFSHYQIETGSCFNTGERLRIQMKDWSPTAGLFRFENGKGHFDPLLPAQFKEPGIEHVVLPLPSGQLLIGDWFRIPAFNDLTASLVDSKEEASLSSISGRATRTRMYAEQLGFVSVSTGDRGPEVFRQGNNLTFGSPDCAGFYDTDIAEEAAKASAVIEPAGISQGRVNGSLWACSMIDRQVLVDLVARQMDLEQAAAAVAELEAEGDILKIQMPPGDYHLYYAGRPELFDKEFFCDEVGLEGFAPAFCVVSQNELTMRPKPGARAPRPGR